jgi:hypothetical protein
MKKLFITLGLLAAFAMSAHADQVTSRFIADGAVINAKIGADAVGGSKFRLENATSLRARNAAGDADVNLFSLTAGDILTFPAFPVGPSSAPSNNYEFANKKYVDDQVSGVPAAKTWLHEVITLVEGDITAQYVDSSQNCIIASSMLFISGVKGAITTDYTLSSVSSKLRISFAATGWGTGGTSVLVAGDKIDLTCQY